MTVALRMPSSVFVTCVCTFVIMYIAYFIRHLTFWVILYCIFLRLLFYSWLQYAKTYFRGFFKPLKDCKKIYIFLPAWKFELIYWMCDRNLLSICIWAGVENVKADLQTGKLKVRLHPWQTTKHTVAICCCLFKTPPCHCILKTIHVKKEKHQFFPLLH